MIKRFNEFNEEEQAYILKMNDSWFCAEMSDCYANTKREEEALLKAFNENLVTTLAHIVLHFMASLKKFFSFN